MRKPKREEIPYIFSIIITSIGILYNLYPLSTSNVLILFGIDVLLSMAWWRTSILSRIETSLKKETIFIDRGELPRLSERLGRAKKSVWFMSQSFPRLIGADFGLLEKCCNRRCEIKILMLNPDAVRDRMVSNIDKESLRKQIEASINIIRTFKKRSEKGAFIDARLLPFEPVVGLFIIDGDLPEGEIKVELHLKNTAPEEWPNVIITRKESERYNQFMKHFIELLKLSDPI